MTVAPRSVRAVRAALVTCTSTRHGTGTRRGGARRIPRDQARSPRFHSRTEALLVSLPTATRRDSRVTPRAPCIAVVGGAGAMGRIVMRDLAEFAPQAIELLLADRDRNTAERIARTLPRRVRVVDVDATSAART